MPASGRARASITDGLDLVSSHAYAEPRRSPRPVDDGSAAESPVHWCTPEGFEPFWAITRHADICEISKQPETFSSASGIAMIRQAEDEAIRQQNQGFGAMRVIIEMDPPEHRSYRSVIAARSSPRERSRPGRRHPDQRPGDRRPAGRRHRRGRVRLRQRRRGRPSRCASSRPCWACRARASPTSCGSPTSSSRPTIRTCSARARTGASPSIALGLELYQLFDKIIQDRRANPRDDLASLLANAKIDGEPMGMMETLGYFLITFTAGHDTTKNSLVGGMRAFLDNPDQFEKLKRDPALLDSAVEEVIRWTSPVNHMKRKVTRDYELRGQKLRAGDWLVMFYASANRDEESSTPPSSSASTASPTPTSASGSASTSAWAPTSPAARSARCSRSSRGAWSGRSSAGEPEQIHSAFVVGLKKLPMRYRIAPAA